MTSRNYCITFFKLFDIKKLELNSLIQYAIFCNEICPETKNKHIHGYIELKHAVRMKQIKEIFNDNTIHIEKRQGTAEQAIEYCKKEGDFVEYGKHLGQGHRSDLDTISHKLLIENQNLGEIIENHTSTYIRYHTGIEKVRGYALRKNTIQYRNVKVHVYWGKTGTGKTRSAIEYCTTNKIPYYKLDVANKVWFDGYDGEKVLIIDDFYGWIQAGFLLNILDGHQLRIEVKCGFTYANWDTVFITSNKHPTEWYQNISSNQFDALMRRISEIKQF